VGRNVLRLAAVVEVATGAALLIVPSVVGRVLLGESLDGVATPLGRVAGIALVALGVACWGRPLLGMSIYGAGVALLLAYVGLGSHNPGILLWPAVGLHTDEGVWVVAVLRRRGGGRRRFSSFGMPATSALCPISLDFNYY
jgi:hypothetical protein